MFLRYRPPGGRHNEFENVTRRVVGSAPMSVAIIDRISDHIIDRNNRRPPEELGEQDRSLGPRQCKSGDLSKDISQRVSTVRYSSITTPVLLQSFVSAKNFCTNRLRTSRALCRTPNRKKTSQKIDKTYSWRIKVRRIAYAVVD